MKYKLEDGGMAEGKERAMHQTGNSLSDLKRTLEMKWQWDTPEAFCTR